MLALHRLLAVATSDEETGRRGTLTIIISIGMTALAAALLLSNSLRGGEAFVSLLLITCMAVYIGTAVMARYGMVQTAGYILAGFTELGILAQLLLSPSPTTIAFLIIPLLITSMVLPSTRVWMIYGVSMAGIGAALLRNENYPISDYFSPILLYSMVALLAYLSAQSVGKALQIAYLARKEAEAASKALQQANAGLEVRVGERTASLHEALEAQRMLTDDLQQSLAAQQTMNELINQLAAPIIPVRSDTLVVPLIGHITHQRAQVLLETILHEVERNRTRTVILDLTGVAIVDTMVAQIVTQVATANVLMGARTTLVGVRPEVAQTLVSLGSDLGQFQAAATLQEALV